LILVIAFSVLPFIKNNLVTSWLKHSNLSSGAKDATQTLVGYGGVAIAVLWALFVLGLNFKNVAIVAGALSVGIGFGLQNIVNNFVSGLILLFERPIRRGDWIVVGNTEGYVRDISIRSTRIETFDRADVIVPNSELISNQVTNWMLSNNVGRLKSAVGVAYGSDVEKVMEVLETIADTHPDVISDHPDYPIRVLFINFGDSALNFELRCYVKNVDNRLRIQSDINQSIDREFRKENIEIPFPQRVVHMENTEDT
jgi:small-conductance mechanosensitive channel